jgi:hypothetical protein
MMKAWNYVNLCPVIPTIGVEIRLPVYGHTTKKSCIHCISHVTRFTYVRLYKEHGISYRSVLSDRSISIHSISYSGASPDRPDYLGIGEYMASYLFYRVVSTGRPI